MERRTICPSGTKVQWENIWFTVIDHLLSIFIFATLVVFYWRGTWNVMNIYLLPDYPEYTAWISTAIGIVALEIFYLLQHVLAAYVTEDHLILYVPVTRIHTYVFAFANVNHWRGVWLLWDFYSGVTWLSAMTSIAVGTISLGMLRSFRNVAAPPAIIATDTSPTHFTCTTRFRQKKSKIGWFALDTLFTVVVVHSLVVCYWRGTWTLLDRWLYPDDVNMSGILSLIIGYVIMAICFILEPIIKLTSKALQNNLYANIIFEDWFIFIAAFGVVAIWRGIWLLCDVYILPDNFSASCWLTHGLGVGLLMLTMNANSLTVRGVYLDAEIIDGQVSPFLNFYLRHFRKRGSTNSYNFTEKGEKSGSTNVNMTLKGNNVLEIQTPVTTV